MPNVTAEQASRFRESGYLVIRGFFGTTPFLDQIRAEITALGRVYVADFALANAAEHIRAFAPAARKYFYNGLRHLTSLSRLGSSELLAQTSRELGLKLPILMRASNIRMDMPGETEFLFHWHQDIVYTLGSLNSVTFWVPFGRVDATVGSVEVLPGSHRSGVYPIRYAGGGDPPPHKTMSPKDLWLVQEPSGSGEIVEAEPGDLVVFSTFILHRSVPNQGNDVRWTAQMRHADLAEPEFVSAGYPWGDITNIFNAPHLLERMPWRAPGAA